VWPLLRSLSQSSLYGSLTCIARSELLLGELLLQLGEYEEALRILLKSNHVRQSKDEPRQQVHMLILVAKAAIGHAGFIQQDDNTDGQNGNNNNNSSQYQHQTTCHLMTLTQTQRNAYQLAIQYLKDAITCKFFSFHTNPHISFRLSLNGRMNEF
jgi:hypothetical protein